MSHTDNKLGKDIGTWKAPGPITGFARLYCDCPGVWFARSAVATMIIPEDSTIVVSKDSGYQSKVPSRILRTNIARIENIEPLGDFNIDKCICLSESGTGIEFRTGKYIHSELDRDINNPNGDGIAFKLSKRNTEKPV